MSSKLMTFVVGLFAALAVAAGTMQGCGGGGSGSSGDIALCEQICDKSYSCVPDAGTSEMQGAALCKQNCPSTVAASQGCSNQAAIATALRSCVAMDCAGFSACVQNVPTPTGCQGGTGGSTGMGGAGGSTGTTCDVCTKADACCVALGGTATDCAVKATCDTASADAQATIIMGCQSALAAVANNPSAPPACR